MTLQQPVGSKMWHWKQRGCGVSEESLAKPGSLKGAVPGPSLSTLGPCAPKPPLPGPVSSQGGLERRLST